MEDDKKDKVRSVNMAIGIEMVELIDYVRTRFKEEYGFEPTIIDTTDTIAKRVKERKLF